VEARPTGPVHVELRTPEIIDGNHHPGGQRLAEPSSAVVTQTNWPGILLVWYTDIHATYLRARAFREKLFVQCPSSRRGEHATGVKC
jgi:hypothetical protein